MQAVVRLGRKALDFVEPGQLSRRRRFIVSVALLSLLFFWWSMATPIFGVPDEPAHMVRSAGISNGQFQGEQQSEGNPLFSVPEILANDACFAFQPNVTAACLSLSGGSAEIKVPSSAATYPPTSHIVFSIPLLFSNGVGSLYLMRLFGSSVCALLFAFGIDSLSSSLRRPSGAVAVALVLTPMTLALCATVNPSGLAISSAFATWAAAIALSRKSSQHITSSSLIRIYAPFVLFLAVRRDSLIWGVAIFICCLLLQPWSHVRPTMRNIATWLLAPVVFLEGLLHMFVWGGPNGQGISESGSLLGSSTTGNAKAAFGRLPSYFNEAIGVLGWLDTVLPDLVYLAWGSLIIGITALAFSSGERRTRTALLLCFAFFVLIPVKIGSVQYPYLQGRYTLPLLIGAPLIATLPFAPTPMSPLGNRKSSFRINALIWLLGIISFAQSLRRFSNGLSSPWSSLLHPEWNPPLLSTGFLLMTYPIVLGIVLVWLVRLMTPSQYNNE